MYYRYRFFSFFLISVVFTKSFLFQLCFYLLFFYFFILFTLNSRSLFSIVQTLCIGSVAILPQNINIRITHVTHTHSIVETFSVARKHVFPANSKQQAANSKHRKRASSASMCCFLLPFPSSNNSCFEGSGRLKVRRGRAPEAPRYVRAHVATTLIFHLAKLPILANENTESKIATCGSRTHRIHRGFAFPLTQPL